MAKKTRFSKAARLIPGSGLLTLLLLAPSLPGTPAVARMVEPPPAPPKPMRPASGASGPAATAAAALPEAAAPPMPPANPAPRVSGPGLGAQPPSGASAAGAAAPPGAGAAANAANAAKANRNTVGCLIGPERMADIGTAVTGVVADIKVDRGDQVRRGQTLVVLEQDVERAQVQAVAARHAIDSEIRSAEANLALAKERYDRMKGLSGSGAVAALSIDQARAEYNVAAQRLEQARGQRRVVQQELGVAQAQLAQRTLRAPFDGVVVERLTQEGERVEDKPLVRLAQLDPLRVELVMPSSRWGSVQRGDALALLPDLPNAGRLMAKVTAIDKTLDGASNTFRVRLVLPNPDYKVPAGARCRLEGVDDAPPAKPAAGPNGARGA